MSVVRLKLWTLAGVGRYLLPTESLLCGERYSFWEISCLIDNSRNCKSAPYALLSSSDKYKLDSSTYLLSSYSDESVLKIRISYQNLQKWRWQIGVVLIYSQCLYRTCHRGDMTNYCIVLYCGHFINTWLTHMFAKQNLSPRLRGRRAWIKK